MANKTSGAPLVAAVLLGCLVLGIGVSKATGYWKTEASKVPMTIAEGEFAGMPDPGDIRGSYAFADIEEAFGIPPAVLAEAFAIPGENPGEILAKELETVWEGAAGESEVGTDAIRLFTALWTGLPHEPESTTALPSSAVEALLAAGKIDGVRAAALKVVDGASIAPAGEGTDDGKVPQEGHAVTGRTTFGDLKEWGVGEGAWTETFGAPMGPDGEALRDWFEKAESSFAQSKSALQDLVDESN